MPLQLNFRSAPTGGQSTSISSSLLLSSLARHMNPIDAFRPLASAATPASGLAGALSVRQPPTLIVASLAGWPTGML